MLLNKVFILVIVTCISSSSGIIINCLFDDFSWQIGLRYTCTVDVVDMSGNAAAFLDVTGIHQPARTNSHVLGIRFLRNPFDRMPTNIESFFPNLMFIAFYGGNLTFISAENLKPFRNLQQFFVNSNQISIIEGDLFKYSPNIQIMQFWGNRITNVGHGLLIGLRMLRQADFGRNSCIDISASQETIANLTRALLLQCPPLATITTISTTSSDCNVRCTINEETDELRSQVNALADANEKQEERINELEKRLSELSLP